MFVGELPLVAGKIGDGSGDGADPVQTAGTELLLGQRPFEHRSGALPEWGDVFDLQRRQTTVGRHSTIRSDPSGGRDSVEHSRRRLSRIRAQQLRCVWSFDSNPDIETVEQRS